MPRRAYANFYTSTMVVERQGGRDIGRRNLKILSKLLHFITFFFDFWTKLSRDDPLESFY